MPRSACQTRHMNTTEANTTHIVHASVIGSNGRSKTYRPRCRNCGWQGTNTTRRSAAEAQGQRHAASPHPYERDGRAYEVGQRHAAENRYSLTSSTGPAWVYWYEQGRGDALRAAQ